MSIIVSDIRNIMQLKNQGLRSMLKAQKTVLASDNAHIPISSIAHAEFQYKDGKKEIIYEVPVFVDLNAVLETITIETASRAFYSSYIVRSFKREQYTYMILRGIILCTGNIMVPTMFMALCTHRDRLYKVQDVRWNSFSDLVLFIDKRFHSRAHSYMWRNMNRNIVLALQALGTEIRFVDSVEDECAKVSCIQVDIPSNIAVTEADKYISDSMNSKLRALLNPPAPVDTPTTDSPTVGAARERLRRVRRARTGDAIGIDIEDDTEPSPPRVLDASDLQSQVTYTPIPTNFTGYHVGVDPITYQATTSARIATTGTIPQGISEEESVATYQYQPFSVDINAIPNNYASVEEVMRIQQESGVMLLDNRQSLRLEQEIRSDMYDLQLPIEPIEGDVVHPIDLTSLDRTTREYTETVDRLQALMNAQIGISQERLGEPQPREDMSP